MSAEIAPILSLDTAGAFGQMKAEIRRRRTMLAPARKSVSDRMKKYSASRAGRKK
jgi:hypothetical protein